MTSHAPRHEHDLKLVRKLGFATYRRCVCGYETFLPLDDRLSDDGPSEAAVRLARHIVSYGAETTGDATVLAREVLRLDEGKP